MKGGRSPNFFPFLRNHQVWRSNEEIDMSLAWSLCLTPGVPILVSILSGNMGWLHCTQPLKPAWSCSLLGVNAFSPPATMRQLPIGDRWASALHQLFPWPLGQLITCFQGLPLGLTPAPRSFPRLSHKLIRLFPFCEFHTVLNCWAILRCDHSSMGSKLQAFTDLLKTLVYVVSVLLYWSIKKQLDTALMEGSLVIRIKKL